MKTILKYLVLQLKKAENLSALAMRLSKLTGKSEVPTHPKHLIKTKIWYESFLNKKMKILDFGCGNGTQLLKVSHCIGEGIGIDISEIYLKNATKIAYNKSISNLHFFKHDCNLKVPIKKSSFDAVVCSDVLEHLNDKVRPLQEIKRLLKPMGTLFLVVDNPETTWKKIQKSFNINYYADPEHRYEYPKGEILQLLKDNDFKIISTKVVTFDSPLTGLIDITGGLSLSLYKILRQAREKLVTYYPNETTGFRIIARKQKGLNNY